MATVDESLFAKTPLGSDLAAGVDLLSLNQEITFTRYVRLVLPIDGYVFWVNASLIGPSALYNKAGLNKVPFNKSPNTVVAAVTKIIKGSLHYATDTRQDESETYSANRVVFTSEFEVTDLNDVAPGELWLGEFEGVRFAFSSRSSFYRQAGLWHYVGFAVYADMATQIIDNLSGFSAAQIVSNSLPAWLGLNSYAPVYGFAPGVTLYPSYLSPDNLPPPYGAVHIVPETTIGLASAPLIGRDSSHSQLCSETVKITLWGTRNFSALDFVDAVYQYAEDTNLIGIMNIPVPRDEKRTQSELRTIAMKKTVDFQVSYHQRRMNDVARMLIETAIPSFFVSDAA